VEHPAGERRSLTCPGCNGAMIWCFPVLAIRTNKTFAAMYDDDGFGRDEFARRNARAAARKAGVSTTGKRFFPGLCRKGMPHDPGAWQPTTRDAVRERAAKIGAKLEGSVNYTPPDWNDHGSDAKPYQVADSVVHTEMDCLLKDHKGKISPKERKQLMETTRTRLSGNG